MTPLKQFVCFFWLCRITPRIQEKQQRVWKIRFGESQNLKKTKRVLEKTRGGKSLSDLEKLNMISISVKKREMEIRYLSTQLKELRHLKIILFSMNGIPHPTHVKPGKPKSFIVIFLFRKHKQIEHITFGNP